MFERSAIFMKWCTKIRPHKWRCDVEHVRHVEGRKEENDEMGFAGGAWPKEKNWIHFFLCNELQKLQQHLWKWCTKVKPHKWRCDVKLVRHIEGRKEEKYEKI